MSVGEREALELRGEASIRPSSWYWNWALASSDSLDSAKVALLPANTEASWGQDQQGKNYRQEMGLGAQFYIIWGLVACVSAVAIAIFLGTLIEWPSRSHLPLPHHPSWFRRGLRNLSIAFLELVDNVPKLLLLLAAYQIFGLVNHVTFSFGMAVFLMLGATALFRERISAYLTSEPYIYALEIGLSPSRIYCDHLLGRTLFPLFLVQIPFMVSAFILWESTLAFLNNAVQMHSWGQLIVVNRTTVDHLVKDGPKTVSYDWSFWIPLVSLIFVVSALYLLGDALRERLEPNGNG